MTDKRIHRGHRVLWHQAIDVLDLAEWLQDPRTPELATHVVPTPVRRQQPCGAPNVEQGVQGFTP